MSLTWRSAQRRWCYYCSDSNDENNVSVSLKLHSHCACDQMVSANYEK